jgi:hypothetical protein
VMKVKLDHSIDESLNTGIDKVIGLHFRRNRVTCQVQNESSPNKGA